jgi:hypothetical protein
VEAEETAAIRSLKKEAEIQAVKASTGLAQHDATTAETLGRIGEMKARYELCTLSLRHLGKQKSSALRRRQSIQFPVARTI